MLIVKKLKLNKEFSFKSGFASGFSSSFFSPGTELGGDGAGGFTLRTTIAGGCRWNCL